MQNLAATEYEVLVEASAIGVALVSAEGRWLTSNPALCELLGYSADELAGLTFQQITHPDDLEKDLALVRAIVEGRRDRYRLDKRYLRKDGSIVYAHLSVGAVRDDRGKLLRFVSQIQDLTAHIATAAQLEAVLAAIPAVVLIRDRNGVCTQVLSGGAGMVFSADQMLGRSICDIAPPKVARQMIAAIRKALSRRETVRLEYPLWVRGETLWFAASVTPLNDRETLIVATDHTQGRREHLALYDRATRDGMTGLHNRAAFIERVRESIAAQSRQFGKSFALLLVDIDHLKQINSEFGHPGGDRAIVAIADQLRQAIRQGDLAARLTGGDEFAMLLQGIGREGAIARAEEIRRGIREMVVNYGNRTIPVSVSIGLAMFPADGESFEALYEVAAARLMLGKVEGRDRVCAN